MLDNSQLLSYSSMQRSISTTMLLAKDPSSSGGDGEEAGGSSGGGQGWISRILSGPAYLEGMQKQSHSSLLSDSEVVYELQSML